MGTIHTLPTEKPSRLLIYSTLLNEFRLVNKPIENWSHKRHIYITSDEEIKTDKFSNNAWLLYDEFYNCGKIKISDEEKIELYNSQLLIYASEQRNEFKSKNDLVAKNLLLDLNNKIKSGNSIQLVKNKCKSVLVCNYLKKNMYDFETFKNSILE